MAMIYGEMVNLMPISDDEKYLKMFEFYTQIQILLVTLI